MNSRMTLGLAVVGAIAIAAASLAIRQRAGVPDLVLTKVPPPAAAPAVPGSQSIQEIVPIRRGSTLDQLLAGAGIEQGPRLELIQAIGRTFDVRRMRAGAELLLTRSITGELESVEYSIDPDHQLRIRHSPSGYEAAIVEVPGVVREVAVCGTIEGSLFESMERAGERPELALEVARIFAWDIDFYTDPQNGDEFCLLVEKKEYANGQPATYWRVLAAKYVNVQKSYDAFLFPGEDGEPRYYSHDGRSLQAAFLRSPLKFEARVSSRFSHRRYHPVLHRYRAHLGTDYAAPAGSSVQAVASGVVTFSGRSGGSGNLVRIRHSNGYESMYLHLSRRFVRAGERVAQGHRIGLVGSTGLATGPHLDFRIRKNGRFVDFERMRPPRATEVGKARMAEFHAHRDRLAAFIEQGGEGAGATVD